MLRGSRRTLTVREFAEREGVPDDTVRNWIHHAKIRARDLNAGTGKRPRWRIPATQTRPDARG